MRIKRFAIESLGNSSYMLISQQSKTCAIIDPVRDVDFYLQEAEARGISIQYTLETHLHNDYVSGSRELVARTGATVCASEAGGLQFDHKPLRNGDSIDMGEVAIDVLATPGHTPEHLSYLVTDRSRGGGPHALFSGGALLVGGVARSDLLGKQLAPFLARWFYQTIQQKLKPLHDSIEVYPTHGGGSFCLAAPSDNDSPTTTIGQERLSNPYFQAQSESEFLDLALGDLPSYPAYYKRMAGMNRRGPRVLGNLPELYPLTPREFWSWVQDKASAVDTRLPEEFAKAHIPRAYNITFGSSLSTWVGWLIPEGDPLVFHTEDVEQHEEIVRQLIRLGYDDLLGYLDGGLSRWREAGLPTESLRAVSTEKLHDAWQNSQDKMLVDVRFNHEWKLGHVPRSINVELGDIPEHVDGLPREMSLIAMCAGGFRASTAASVLQREGFSDVTLVLGGTDTWQKASYEIEK